MTDGNAPMIPRRAIIEILNEVQLLQTRLVILLNQHAPEHFKETQAREPKVSQPVWAESTTGLPESELVRTTTDGEVLPVCTTDK